jgi:dUTP pyrophosphatase
MKIRVKKLSEAAVIPQYAKEGDAGLDLVATSRRMDPKGFIEFGTSLAIEIPSGYVGLVFPRSSISKINMSFTNAVGVIDSGYRGEILCRFKPSFAGQGIYEIGDKVAQLMILPYPEIELEEAEELSETVRGAGGFGSTGKEHTFINENGLVEKFTNG